MTQDLVPLQLDNNFFPSFSPTLFHLGLFLKISIEKSSKMRKYNMTKKLPVVKYKESRDC